MNVIEKQSERTDNWDDPAVSVEYDPPHNRFRRTAKRVIWGLAAVLALVALWFAYAAFAVSQDASALRSSASAFQTAMYEEDYTAAAQGLSDARSRSGSLAGRLSSGPWPWLQSVPWVGPSISAVAVLAEGTHSVLLQTDGFNQVLESAGNGEDVGSTWASLQEVTPQLSAAGEAARGAAGDVAAIDAEALAVPYRDQIAQAREQFLGLVEPLTQSSDVAAVLPRMFGVTEPARWLLIMGQGAPGSASGLYGAYTSAEVINGQFYALSTPTAAHPESGEAQAASPRSPEFAQLWGSHYADTASAAQQALDPAAQYVVTLDPQSVVGLLAATGPVTVEGVKLSKANGESYFARDIYTTYPDSAQRGAFTSAFLQRVITRLGTQPLEPATLVRTFGAPAGGGHVKVWSSDPVAQAAIVRTHLGGSVVGS